MEKFVASTTLKPSYASALALPEYLKVVDPEQAVGELGLIAGVSSLQADPNDEIEDMWDNVPI
ncbi:MAG: hypothetical protein AAF230_04885 [Pseudomonadota bacterium]